MAKAERARLVQLEEATKLKAKRLKEKKDYDAYIEKRQIERQKEEDERRHKEEEERKLKEEEERKLKEEEERKLKEEEERKLKEEEEKRLKELQGQERIIQPEEEKKD